MLFFAFFLSFFHDSWISNSLFIFFNLSVIAFCFLICFPMFALFFLLIYFFHSSFWLGFPFYNWPPPLPLKRLIRKNGLPICFQWPIAECLRSSVSNPLVSLGTSIGWLRKTRRLVEFFHRSLPYCYQGTREWTHFARSDSLIPTFIWENNMNYLKHYLQACMQDRVGREVKPNYKRIFFEPFIMQDRWIIQIISARHE